MNPKDLMDMAGDPRFIPGIYNYCDRWCERCAFTERCLTFASTAQMQREFEQGYDGEDEFDGEALVDEFGDTLQDTIDLIHTIADEEGIDLDLDSPEIDAMMAQEARAQERAASHPLTMAANAYVGLVNDWLGGQREHRPSPDAETDLEPPAGSDAEQVADAVQVIRWFQFFIAVKIQRALSGQDREAAEPEFWEEMPRDSDGTAKVTLIAVDRSVGAWAALLPLFPERKTATLEILALLSSLRLNLEREFPEAWTFIRPGFDEVDLE